MPGPEIIKGGITLNGLVNVGVGTGQNLPYNQVVQAWNAQTGASLPNFPQAVEDYQLLSSPAVADVSDAPRNDSNGPKLPPQLPDPDIEPRSRWLPSLVWVIPLIAALIGIALVIKSVTEKGPTITISFISAEGLEPGKTKVKYKDVDVGAVKSITLSKDLSHVLVQVQLTKEGEDFAVKDSRFWVVRPRVGASGVSGLTT